VEQEQQLLLMELQQQELVVVEVDPIMVVLQYQVE
tara:strand:+ start:389 stop:493 length:105 start_codon:yes stop_codon:yes gene_type:complete